ncbi:hypothetical protein BaRGS_00007079 [Batillaria attramentaria]|uniref:Uncharacterized protein n=1 Tax=Batillaria attramentaria TaxID=370345 RepID=A0ABD0LRH5_9CAEN
MASKKRCGLSLKRKLEILDFVEKSKKSKRKLADELGVPRSTLYDILKEKEKLEERRNSGSASLDTVKHRTANYAELDRRLLDWLKFARSQNIPISGPVLKIRANKIAEDLGIQDWNCSDGWLTRWKKRNNIVSKAESGERGSVDEKATDEWVRNVLKPLLARYEARDVFNVDETALFWRMLPGKSLCFKGERCIGGKKSKDRITVMICSNMNGTEKPRLLTIGKFKNPRCFKGIKRLPVQYEANSKCWMNADIFKDWLQKFDNRMVQEKRKVLLVLDNCTAHKLPPLRATEVVFLPPNATSKLQPCDAGVIQNLKVHYRTMKVHQLTDHIDAGGTSEDYQFSLLDALCTIQQAWEKVTPTTIANCFRHAGFHVDETETTSVDSTEDVLPELDPLVSKLADEHGISSSDYFFVDEDVATTAPSSDIPSTSTAEGISSEPKVEELDSDEDDLGEREIVSKVMAVDCLQKIEQYSLQATCNCCDSALRDLRAAMDKHFTFCQKRQEKITSYFQKSKPNEGGSSDRHTPSPADRHTPSPADRHTPSPPKEGPSKPRSPSSPPKDRCRCTLSEATAPPTYPIYGFLSPLLASAGRRVDYVKMDGNCFFRCLSKEMYGTEEYHPIFRESVCNLIDKNPAVFAQYIDGADTRSHAEKMRKLGKWATTCEIYASASLLQRKLYVLTPIPGQKQRSDRPDLSYRWLLFSPLKLCDREEGGPAYLTLCNTDGNHYDRITPSVAECNCKLPPPVIIYCAQSDLLTTFLLYPRHYISDRNIAQYTGLTDEQCQNKCLQNAQCRTCELRGDLNVCNIASATPLHYTNWISTTDDRIKFWQRMCR